jgi:hypothetical protein
MDHDIGFQEEKKNIAKTNTPIKTFSHQSLLCMHMNLHCTIPTRGYDRSKKKPIGKLDN